MSLTVDFEEERSIAILFLTLYGNFVKVQALADAFNYLTALISTRVMFKSERC